MSHSILFYDLGCPQYCKVYVKKWSTYGVNKFRLGDEIRSVDWGSDAE